MISRTSRVPGDTGYVGIIFRLPRLDRSLLLESVENVGVRLAPLSKYLLDHRDGRPYGGPAVIARPRGVSAAVIGKLARFGIDQLTRPYDKDEIAKTMGSIVFGGGRRKRDNEHIRSELVFECFKAAGRVFPHDERGFISPENIWTRSTVQAEWRVH